MKAAPQSDFAALAFEALASVDDVRIAVRDNLDGKVRGIRQCLLLSAMNKVTMVSFLEGRLRDGGEAAVLELFTAATDFNEWAKGMAEIAGAIEARVACCLATIADLSAEEVAA